MPFAYNLLPLGAVKSNGWMRPHPELQASALSEHLFDPYRFGKDKDSMWLGETLV